MYVCMYVCFMSWGPTEGQQTKYVVSDCFEDSSHSDCAKKPRLQFILQAWFLCTEGKKVSGKKAAFRDISQQLHMGHQRGCGFGSGLVIKVPTCSGRACQTSASHASGAGVPKLPALCRKEVEIIDELSQLHQGYHKHPRLVISLTMSRSLRLCCLAFVLAVSLVSTRAQIF